MNNTQLFEQSARKILSKNQLESVMQLHNALFGAQDAEQVADTVATAVKDAVDDVVDTAADEQVITDVAEASPSIMSLEDQQNLKTLVDSMSDNEKVNFLESLDDQQMQILMEGPMTWVKNLFSTAGRKANRLDKFGKLATKDAKLSERLDGFHLVVGDEPLVDVELTPLVEGNPVEEASGIDRVALRAARRDLRDAAPGKFRRVRGRPLVCAFLQLNGLHGEWHDLDHGRRVDGKQLLGEGRRSVRRRRFRGERRRRDGEQRNSGGLRCHVTQRAARRACRPWRPCGSA